MVSIGISSDKQKGLMETDQRRPERVCRRLSLLAIYFAISACETQLDIASVQTFYAEGVPHTDRHGQVRLEFDPASSFLPLGIYHALAGAHHGIHYELWPLAAAGFNTVHLWERQAPDKFATQAGEVGLQVIVHWPKEESVQALSGDPALLAWYLDEEPSFLYPAAELEPKFSKFWRNRDIIRRFDRQTPIFILDGPPTKTNRTRWDRWNRAGDITSHFNYPVTVKHLRDYGPVERVAETTAIARRLVYNRKPVWITLQAFGGEGRGWRKPSPETVRAMAYAAVVHGATGLIYFAYDSFVTRDDGILGMSPLPVRDYQVTVDYNADGKPPLVVSDSDLQWSRSMFRAVAGVNAELAQQRSTILSPTGTIDYTVQAVEPLARPDAVRSLLKKSDTGYILITVNVDIEPATVRFYFPHDITSITPLFGSAEPEDMDAHGWTVRYGAEAVAVYRLSVAP